MILSATARRLWWLAGDAGDMDLLMRALVCQEFINLRGARECLSRIGETCEAQAKRTSLP
jgi:hypothetical protein